MRFEKEDYLILLCVAFACVAFTLAWQALCGMLIGAR